MLKYHVLMIVCILTITITKVLPYSSKSINVGTVLFREGDKNKFCWTQEGAILLNSRMIMQDLIPITFQNTQNDLYISAFINYINACLDASCKITRGLSQQLMVLALADTIGGYLRAYLLPATKQAFYAGNIRYEQSKKLFDLFDEVKAILKTNGATWVKPPACFSSKGYKIRPLEILPPPESEDACADFIIFEKPGGCNEKGEQGGPSISIPIPFLDDNRNPHSIAVPLKVLSLHSLEAATSKFLVVKYYVAGTKCLLSHAVSEHDIFKFNRDFRRWLMKAVVPHLTDEKWYPAFGGVLKIFETMKRLGTGDFNDEELNVRRENLDTASGHHQFQEPLLKKAFFDIQCGSVDKDLSAPDPEFDEDHRKPANIKDVLIPPVNVEPVEVKTSTSRVGKVEGAECKKLIAGGSGKAGKAGKAGGTWGGKPSGPSTSFCLISALAVVLAVWLCAGLIYLCLCMCRRTLRKEEKGDKGEKGETPSSSGQRIRDTFVQVYYGLIGRRSSSNCPENDNQDQQGNNPDAENGSNTRCSRAEEADVCQCLVHGGYSANSDSEGGSEMGNSASSR